MDEDTKDAIDSHFSDTLISEEMYYLTQFKQKVWPAYAEMGFTFAEAVMAFRLQSIDAEVWRLRAEIGDD